MKFGSNARCRNAYVSTISGGWWDASSKQAERRKEWFLLFPALVHPRIKSRDVLLVNFKPSRGTNPVITSPKIFIAPIPTYARGFNISLSEFYRPSFGIYVSKLHKPLPQTPKISFTLRCF